MKTDAHKYIQLNSQDDNKKTFSTISNSVIKQRTKKVDYNEGIKPKKLRFTEKIHSLLSPSQYDYKTYAALEKNGLFSPIQIPIKQVINHNLIENYQIKEEIDDNIGNVIDISKYIPQQTKRYSMDSDISATSAYHKKKEDDIPKNLMPNFNANLIDIKKLAKKISDKENLVTNNYEKNLKIKLNREMAHKL